MYEKRTRSRCGEFYNSLTNATYEALLVPGIWVVPRTIPFQETVTSPGKDISAANGPVLVMLPTMTRSMEVAEGLVMSYEMNRECETSGLTTYCVDTQPTFLRLVSLL